MLSGVKIRRRFLESMRIKSQYGFLAEIVSSRGELSSRMVSKPKVDCLSDADKEPNRCPEEFDSFEMVLGYRKHELFEFYQRIVRYLLPHQSTNVKLGNRYRQTLAGGNRNPFYQRRARTLHRTL